jgi:hypothetical protein
MTLTAKAKRGNTIAPIMILSLPFVLSNGLTALFTGAAVMRRDNPINSRSRTDRAAGNYGAQRASRSFANVAFTR